MDEKCQKGEEMLSPSSYLTYLPRLKPSMRTQLRSDIKQMTMLYISQNREDRQGTFSFFGRNTVHHADTMGKVKVVEK